MKWTMERKNKIALCQSAGKVKTNARNFSHRENFTTYLVASFWIVFSYSLLLRFSQKCSFKTLKWDLTDSKVKGCPTASI